jgi:hypothetical protein
MTEIVVPIIATWMKFIVTPVLGFVAILGMVWGARKFFWCVQILRGVAPLPPKATRSGAVGGLVLHLVIIASGAAAGYFLLALLTTQPYVLTDNGLTVGARPLHYQERFVPWSQITRVVCRYGRYDVPGIADIYLYTTHGKERLTNGVIPLEPVRDLPRQQLSDEVMKRCQ